MVPKASWKEGKLIMENTNDFVIATVQESIYKTLNLLVDDKFNYAILDFPDYSNVGDSAIYLGERKVLSDIFLRPPAYVSSIRSHNNKDLNDAFEDGIIFLHGGGNFGDLYPNHQKFREDILWNHPHRKIIQLPQSIHFTNVSARIACARAIEKHPNFTLLVRDFESFEIATTHFNCDVQLCPDSAFALGKLIPSETPQHKALALIRNDKESSLSSSNIEAIENLKIEDWLTDAPNMHSLLDRIVHRASIESRIVNRITRQGLIRIFDTWAQNRLSRGVKQLSRAEFIITDRLHGHIIATLLGIPHLILDNNYGKIFSYVNAWPNSRLGSVTDDLGASLANMIAPEVEI